MRINLKAIIVALVIISIAVMPASAGISWCTPGESYVGTDEAGTGGVTSIIKGTTTFKGNEYCEAEATVESQGFSMTYTYYISEDYEDIWLVMDIMGQKQEIHVQVPEGGITTGTASPAAAATTTTPAAATTTTPAAATTTTPAAAATIPTPGFESVFAIAGLLTVAYLAVRKRR